MSRLVAAIRAQPWAILPEWLAAIEEIALRLEGGDAVARIAFDGHAERLAAFEAATGERVPGTRSAVMVADGVAMVPLIGPIMPRATLMSEISGGLSAEGLGADLAALDASRDVRRILAVVDSGGGAVAGISRLAAQIAGMRTPIVAHVEGTAASAAYWLVSQMREISIDPTAQVGNIGVIMSGQRQESPDASGRRTYEVVSSNAAAKRPDMSTEDGQALIREVTDAIEAEFIDAVAQGRGVTADVVKRDFATKYLRVGHDAKAAKMADRVEFRSAAIDRLAKQIAPTAPRRTIAEATLAVAQLRASL
jgi:ClpP class serine protease